MPKTFERGGLWKVSPGVFEIFLIVEKHFRANVSNQKRKIDVQLRVSTLMMDFRKKEISLNLLQSMITLYLHASTFKYVTFKKEAFKQESSKKKIKSLRTSIKQATMKLELGQIS